MESSLGFILETETARIQNPILSTKRQLLRLQLRGFSPGELIYVGYGFGCQVSLNRLFHFIVTSGCLEQKFGFVVSKFACLRLALNCTHQLFDKMFMLFLLFYDGPFFDNEYYGQSIASHCKELGAVGVYFVEPKAGVLLARYLMFHTDFTAIVSIYNYLNDKRWQSTSETPGRIWIPKGIADSGLWFSLEDCIVHAKKGLFGWLLYVLDGIYKAELCQFFCQSLGVRHNPSTANSCSLWKDWEGANRQLPHAECPSFWSYMVKHWSPPTEKPITESVINIHVASFLGENLLVEKSDEFMPDDLLLKEILEESSSRTLFVWYSKSQAHTQLILQGKTHVVYAKIGVKKISAAHSLCTCAVYRDIMLPFDRRSVIDFGFGLRSHFNLSHVGYQTKVGLYRAIGGDRQYVCGFGGTA